MKKRVVFFVVLMICGVFGLVFNNRAMAKDLNLDKACDSNLSSEAADGAGCNDDRELMDIVKVLLNVGAGLVGVISVIAIILGGFRYMTSSGDAGKVKQAKDTVLYAAIALVVAGLAWAIVNFVLGAF